MTCKHGPQECLGNAHELCLTSHLPLEHWYPTLACLNYQSPFPGDIGQARLARQCVEAAKVDWWESGVGQCILGHKARKDDGKQAEKDGKIGKEALGLLKENVRLTEKKGVTTSCTIEIGNRSHCVVDGGTWLGCDVSWLFPKLGKEGFVDRRMDIQPKTLFVSSRRNGTSSGSINSIEHM